MEEFLQKITEILNWAFLDLIPDLVNAIGGTFGTLIDTVGIIKLIPLFFWAIFAVIRCLPKSGH